MLGKTSQHHFQKWLVQGCPYGITDTGIPGRLHRWLLQVYLPHGPFDSSIEQLPAVSFSL